MAWGGPPAGYGGLIYLGIISISVGGPTAGVWRTKTLRILQGSGGPTTEYGGLKKIEIILRRGCRWGSRRGRTTGGVRRSGKNRIKSISE